MMAMTLSARSFTQKFRFIELYKPYDGVKALNDARVGQTGSESPHQGSMDGENQTDLLTRRSGRSVWFSPSIDP